MSAMPATIYPFPAPVQPRDSMTLVEVEQALARRFATGEASEQRILRGPLAYVRMILGTYGAPMPLTKMERRRYLALTCDCLARMV